MTWYEEILLYLRLNAERLALIVVCVVLLVGVCLPFLIRPEDNHPQ